MTFGGYARGSLLILGSGVACVSGPQADLRTVDAGRPCAELPAVVCDGEGGGADFSAVRCEPTLAACSRSEDGCRQATFVFDRDGCLVADRTADWYPYADCLETALRAKRWPALAGRTITVHESCMPSACSLRPGGLGRAHRR